MYLSNKKKFNVDCFIKIITNNRHTLFIKPNAIFKKRDLQSVQIQIQIQIQYFIKVSLLAIHKYTVHTEYIHTIKQTIHKYVYVYDNCCNS